MVQTMAMTDDNKKTAGHRVPEVQQADGRGPAGAGVHRAEVQAWLDRLPPDARATQLAMAYPRIAERLALLDEDARLVGRYLDGLVIDERGDRNGFPVDVAGELLRLRVHYAEREGPAIGASVWSPISLARPPR